MGRVERSLGLTAAGRKKACDKKNDPSTYLLYDAEAQPRDCCKHKARRNWAKTPASEGSALL